MEPMVAEYGLILLSSTSCVLIYTLYGVKPRPSKIGRMLDTHIMSSYRRRAALYFTILLGIPVNIIANTWSLLLTEPLVFLGLCFIALLCASAMSLMIASSYKVTISKSAGRAARFHTIMKEPCWQELATSTSGNARSNGGADLPESILLDIDNPEWVMSELVTMGISDECIDQIIWSIFFDRFESGHRRFGWIPRGRSQEYASGKACLLTRDDEASTLFRNSLRRWNTRKSRPTDEPDTSTAGCSWPSSL